jgi:hypothetical protein
MTLTRGDCSIYVSGEAEAVSAGKQPAEEWPVETQRAAPTFVASLAWNKWFNPPPFAIRQRPPNQGRPPQLRS